MPKPNYLKQVKKSPLVTCRVKSCGKILTREQSLQHAYRYHRGAFLAWLPSDDMFSLNMISGYKKT